MIILVGDTHGVIEYDKLMKIKDDNLTKNDIVIVLGDFGLYWREHNEEERRIREELGKKNFTLAFLQGNHENFDLIKKNEQIIEWNGGRAGLLDNGIIHLLNGEIYNIDNKLIGVMGGAESIDKASRIEGISWWKDEAITKEDMDNFIANFGKVLHIDYMLSHDCPANLFACYRLWAGQEPFPVNETEFRLNEIDFLANPEKWYFAHHHKDVTIQEKYTCVYRDYIVLDGGN